MSDYEKTPGVWDWVRIPLEFIGGIILGLLLILLLANVLPSVVIGLLWTVIFLGLIARVLWSVYRLHQRKAPNFWVVIGVAGGGGVLMIGVLGIVVAIAAPNFSRYQSKARQSEAKIALAATYGAEKSYFSEYKAYVPSYEKLGYVPEGARRFYMVGFPDACAAKMGIPVEQAQYRVLQSTFAEGREQEIIDYFRSIKECPDPAAGFEAYAVGIIRQGAKLDVWKINDQKILTNVEIGL